MSPKCSPVVNRKNKVPASIEADGTVRQIDEPMQKSTLRVCQKWLKGRGSLEADNTYTWLRLDEPRRLPGGSDTWTDLPGKNVERNVCKGLEAKGNSDTPVKALSGLCGWRVELKEGSGRRQDAFQRVQACFIEPIFGGTSGRSLRLASGFWMF